MAISRKRQYQLLTKNGVENDIKDYKMVEALPLTGVNVVFQGVEGAYSYAAMRAYFSDAINSYHVRTFRDAMEEVASGKADYAVLPIEITRRIVTDIYLLTEYQLYIVGEQGMKVEHVLLGIPGSSLKKSNRLFSSVALAQCKKYLKVIRTGKQSRPKTQQVQQRRSMKNWTERQADCKPGSRRALADYLLQVKHLL